MTAKSLIRKIKSVLGLSDASGSDSDSGTRGKREGTGSVTVEREPETESEDVEGVSGSEPSETTAQEEIQEDVEVSEDQTDATLEDEAETETTLEDETATGAGESVEAIKGIGPTYRDRLEANGIETVADLADSEAERVAEAAQTSEGRATDWIERARTR